MMPCPPGDEKKSQPCPKCIKQGVTMQVTTLSQATSGMVDPPANKGFPVMMISGTLLLAVITVMLTRRGQASADPSADVEYLHCYCKCGRRLRYRPESAGRKGVCPNCKREVPFPYPGAPGKSK
jgi:hypothetical protein